MWPFLAAHVLENARGSSLARISLPAAPRPGWGPGPPRRRNEIQPAKFYVRTSSSFVGVAIFRWVADGFVL